MAQTQINRNDLFYSVKGEPARTKKETITGAADLVAGDIIVPDGAGKYRAAVDADKLGGASEQTAGWRILLEDAAVSGGDVEAATGLTGGIDEVDLKSTPAGLTIDDEVKNTLQVNGVYVQQRTNSIRVAGEGA